MQEAAFVSLYFHKYHMMLVLNLEFWYLHTHSFLYVLIWMVKMCYEHVFAINIYCFWCSNLQIAEINTVFFYDIIV